MSRQEAFSVELGGCAVACQLDLPQASAPRRALPVVMLCPGLPRPGPQMADLHEQITAALVEAGVAVATPIVGAAGAPGSRLAVETVDEAAALFHGLAVREELDLERIGVLGHSLGAIIAACLAKRTDQIRRLCLMSPATSVDVMARLAVEPEGAVAARLGGTAVPPGFFDGLEFLQPVEDVAAHDRPTLIMHGAADRTMAPELSLAYSDAIASAGHSCDHVLVALGDHFFSDAAVRSACLDLLARFFAAPDGAPRR